jgi:hypothetical protein
LVLPPAWARATASPTHGQHSTPGGRASQPHLSSPPARCLAPSARCRPTIGLPPVEPWLLWVWPLAGKAGSSPDVHQQKLKFVPAQAAPGPLATYGARGAGGYLLAAECIYRDAETRARASRSAHHAFLGVRRSRSTPDQADASVHATGLRPDRCVVPLECAAPAPRAVSHAGWLRSERWTKDTARKQWDSYTGQCMHLFTPCTPCCGMLGVAATQTLTRSRKLMRGGQLRARLRERASGVCHQTMLTERRARGGNQAWRTARRRSWPSRRSSRR